MNARRSLVVAAAALAISVSAAQAQDLSQYRDFKLGDSLAAIAARSGASASQATVIHQRPALMQELEWRPSYFVGGSNEQQTDPVRQIVFAFYNDQLSRIVVDYDPQRTEGMTAADVIDALSTTFGPKSKLAGAASPAQESEAPVARWVTADTSAVLLRTAFASTYRLVLTSRRLEALARTADTRALQLDAREGPQREMARQKKEAADTKASQEKARLVNKAAFRP